METKFVPRYFLLCLILMAIFYQVTSLRCFICVPEGDELFIKQRRDQIQAEFGNSAINCSMFDTEMNGTAKVKECPKSFRNMKCLKTIIEVNGTKSIARECDERYEELESDSMRIMSGEVRMMDDARGVKLTMRICTTDECNGNMMDMMDSKGPTLELLSGGIMALLVFAVKKVV